MIGKVNVFFVFLFLFLCNSFYLSAKKIQITVTVPPLADFVRNVCGPMVDVTTLIERHVDPHTYQPTFQQLASFRESDIYVQVGSGIEFEVLLMENVLPLFSHILVCNASKNIKTTEGLNHHHTSQEDDDHEKYNDHGIDPHVWLSVHNAMIMVENIRDTLVEFDPPNKQYYKERASNYMLQLKQLKQNIHDTLKHIINRNFFVFHSAWQYFSDEFDFTQIAVEVDGKSLSLKHMHQIVSSVKKKNIDVLFASPSDNQKAIASIVKELDGKVVFIDQLSPNYIDNMLKLLRELVLANKTSKSP